MWESVERAPDTYNMTYLDDVEVLINKLGNRGIYTLVDMHQDVLARKICGEGVPDFYADNLPTHCEGSLLATLAEQYGICNSISSYGFRYDEDGNPLIEDCQKHNFAGYYPSPESIELFDRLYTNKTGLTDKFINYWKVVAQRFAGNPYVVGYDPLNEPFPGGILTDPSMFLQPGKFDKVSLEPLYERIHREAYQPADPTKINFFEPGEFPD
jgi:endoglycosylceramidase